MIYKCKQCGFKDCTIGIQAHLVMNRCGKIEGFNLKSSSLTDYTEIMTQTQFDKELKKCNEDAIKKQQLEREGKVLVKEKTEINKEGKEVTKTRFIVEKGKNENSKS